MYLYHTVCDNNTFSNKRLTPVVSWHMSGNLELAKIYWENAALKTLPSRYKSTVSINLAGV